MDKRCEIEGCGLPVLARGMCSAHYARWQRGSDPKAEPRSKNQRSYELPLSEELLRLEYQENGLSQDEIAVKYGITQKVVWRAMKRAGIEQRVAAKRDQRGEKNDTWKGGRLFYPKHDERAITRHGHRRGYYKIKAEGHPHANKQGYVWEHVHVALEAAGRERLEPGEVVHHINCDPLDNRPENLCILQDHRHREIHASLEQVIGELVDRGMVRFSPEEGYVVAEGGGGDAQ